MMKIDKPFIKKISFQIACIAVCSFLAGLGLNLIRSDGIALIGDYTAEEEHVIDYRGISTVTPEKAEQLHADGEAVFVDARSQWEYQEGHIPGAILVPSHEAAQYLAEFRKKVPDTSSAIITYCDGEYCPLSKDLASVLRNNGYTNVHVLVNGWGVWQSRGYAVERGGAVDNPASGGNLQ